MQAPPRLIQRPPQKEKDRSSNNSETSQNLPIKPPDKSENLHLGHRLPTAQILKTVPHPQPQVAHGHHNLKPRITNSLETSHTSVQMPTYRPQTQGHQSTKRSESAPPDIQAHTAYDTSSHDEHNPLRYPKGSERSNVPKLHLY